MFRIGLTGGIASGKSTAADVFTELGAAVVDTDVIARDVVAPGESGLEAVAAEFGSDVLLPNGELDRRALRSIVFSDPQRREVLESILHPLIRARTLRVIASLEAPYVIVVVPLLLETGFAELVERILVVDCPEAQQLERLRQRDGVGESEAQAMLAAQTDRQTRLARADDVIDNSGSIEATRAQVKALHERYLAMAANGLGSE
ncbi:MAG: dephospho-CoA kinase [Gammaproteobacteria bacterium]|nr:dephospho-CoA kinase [Gammaproteobacteria bacterium]MDH3505995.1 dephospho-CoA kinase [Gammaproteobacteria bacterium]